MNLKNYLKSIAIYLLTGKTEPQQQINPVSMINTNRLFDVNRQPIIVALNEPGGNFRFEVTAAVLDARKNIRKYITEIRQSLVKRHDAPFLAIEKLDIIDNLFEGLFMEFLDVPTLSNGTKIENFWQEAKPLLIMLENY